MDFSGKAESCHTPDDKSFWRHPAVVVGLITLLGAVLRLMFLSRPSLWLDEAATYRRISGSFSDLIESLRETGFTPLHYLLCWVISRIRPMTPFMMRLPTAIAGTAMIPAMYWLAVQLVSRRTAYVIALFTATSAYLLNYSRDAKMYVDCWLFVTVSAACLLWWLKSDRFIAWCCWVVAGLVMVGIHATAAMLLPVMAVVFLTHSKFGWRRLVLFVVGLLIVGGSMATYYKLCNRYYQRVKEDWSESGLDWIERENAGRDGPKLLRYTGTHFLYAWEWPTPRSERDIDPRVLKACKVVATSIFAVISIGVIPWRKNEGKIAVWRPLLWLAIWLALPTFATYCASTNDRMGPTAWLAQVRTYPFASAAIALALLAQLIRGETWRKRLTNLLVPLAVLGAVLAAYVIVYLVVPAQPSSVWKPRYIGIVWPAMAIVVCVLLMRLPTRPIRWLAITTLIAVNLFRHVAFLYINCEPPIELMARDILATGSPDGSTRTYIGRLNPTLLGPGSKFFTPTMPYYLYVLSGRPTTPNDYNQDWESKFQVRAAFVPMQFFVPPDVRNNTNVKRFIVWQRLRINAGDPLLKMLGGGWKLVSNEDFLLWDRWTWERGDSVQRRIYQRE